ncbi:MAG TPA: hypothetical protein VKZ79_06060 [Alphaproteobacteria bacterium]|nr:hypothetical protein [Alphaproteobacteria bacterium]
MNRLGALAAFAVAFGFAQSALAADARGGGPSALLMTYHAMPANRPLLMRELLQSEVRQLQQWKETGVIESYRLLTNRYADSVTWDAALILTFRNEAALAGWKRVEHEFPAGLTPKALALTSAVETAPADLMREGRARDDATEPTFLVIPYDYAVPEGDYLKYLDGYTIPQLSGWIDEGVLARYSIYLGRYPAGRPWSALLVLEYKDDAAFAQREAVVAKVRARLAANPTWKAFADDKKNIRTEKAPTVADLVATDGGVP